MHVCVHGLATLLLFSPCWSTVIATVVTYAIVLYSVSTPFLLVPSDHHTQRKIYPNKQRHLATYSKMCLRR